MVFPPPPLIADIEPTRPPRRAGRPGDRDRRYIDWYDNRRLYGELGTSRLPNTKPYTQ